MKKIVVACGSGVATSQTVASKVGRLLKEKDLKISELRLSISNLWIIISGILLLMWRLQK